MREAANRGHRLGDVRTDGRGSGGQRLRWLAAPALLVASGFCCPAEPVPWGTVWCTSDVTECEVGEAIVTPTVSFAADVLPLLEASGCLSAGCHGGAFPASDYSMTTYADLFRAGIQADGFGACPIVPGDPDSSYLVEKISAFPRTGARMPFLGSALTDDEIDTVRTWISEGAADN